MSGYEFLGRSAYWLSKPWQWTMLSRFPRAYILILADDEVLLVKNWLGNGEWSLPGGGIQKGETAQIAVIRELEEETGIKIGKKQLAFLLFKREKSLRRKTYSLFKGELSAKPESSWNQTELTGFCWVHKDSLKTMRCSREVFEALEADI